MWSKLRRVGLRDNLVLPTIPGRKSPWFIFVNIEQLVGAQLLPGWDLGTAWWWSCPELGAPTSVVAHWSAGTAFMQTGVGRG